MSTVGALDGRSRKNTAIRLLKGSGRLRLRGAANFPGRSGRVNVVEWFRFTISWRVNRAAVKNPKRGEEKARKCLVHVKPLPSD